MERNYGLLPLEKDKRDFSLGAAFVYPKLEELPENFEHTPFKIKNQFSSDFCSSFASSSASELQEGIELSPEFAFAMSKKLSGNVSAWGQNLRDAMSAHVKIGCIEQKDAPFAVTNKPDTFLRDPANWPETLDDEALVHAKSSYMDCKGPFDAFDNLRAAIWMFRDEKCCPVIGLEWGWGTGEPYIKTISGGFGHAIVCIGWRTIGNETYLTIQNSWGDQVGDHGKFYLSRDVINNYIPKYGAMMFVDMTKEEYQSRLKALGQSWVLRALNAVLRILGILAVQMQKTPPDAQVLPNPTPIIPVLPPEPAVTPFSPTIVKWANAIEIMENSPKDWNNPGAIKNYNGEFIKFSSHQIGFDYLCDYLTRVCTGKHLAYPKGGETTLIEFQKIYSPTNDNNNPLNYATFIAGKLGIAIETKIGTLI